MKATFLDFLNLYLFTVDWLYTKQLSKKYGPRNGNQFDNK